MVSLLFVICFFTLSINQYIVNSKDAEDPLCYGFILSLVMCKNTTTENQINCKIKHMINDLLREQIPVYWLSKNITTVVEEIYESKTEKMMFFEKGTFVIPFTENYTKDKKLTAIIFDYNQSSEIEENNTIKIPIYELKRSLTIETYQLSEVKIAMFTSRITDGDSFYLNAAEKCGFLTFEFLEDKNLAKKLDNTKFNVIIWPAGGTSYYCNRMLNFFVMGSIDFASSLIYNRYNIIRNFVGNGGGYIGFCYGAYVASCGVIPAPIYLKRRAYNPKLTSIGILAISDVVTIPITKPFGVIHEQIINNSHPLTYDLDTILIDGCVLGPKFVHVGKNSQVVANFYNTDKYVDGTPSWISSNFGNGKVLLFSGHPEFIDSDVYPEFIEPAVKDYYNGKKIISNALFYTTSKEKSELHLTQSRPISFIVEIWERTANLTGTSTKTEDIFKDININEIISEIKNFSNEINLSINIIRKIAFSKNIDVDNNSLTFLSYYRTCFLQYYLDLFIEYFGKTANTLRILEEVYPILKGNSEFVQQLENLKTDLLEKTDKTRYILSKSQTIYQDYENLLLDYQHERTPSKLQEYQINKKAYDLSKQIVKGYLYVPQFYLNSLKFLRSYWYNYESMC